MCGILGSTYKQGDFDKALKLIEHRGPDGKKIKELPDCTLGFVRLSIRDLSEKAMQPMASDDENVWVTYNGEIYGCEELKSDLISKGYEFKTTSDTEIILNAYLEYKEKFVEHIDGMFAIVIYDLSVNKLFLYRDRVGIKPLYYFFNGNIFTFSSELKAILELHSDIKFERDNSAIYDYFTYRYIPEPKTLFQKIYKLEPAHKAVFDLKRKHFYKEKYWKLRVNTETEKRHNEQDIYRKARHLIAESVEEQLVADVPVGTFLSGGIDSSIVSVEIFKRTKTVQAFSMGFQTSNKKDKAYDETPYARILADMYQFPIIFGQFDSIQLHKLKGKVKTWFDEPFADTSCYPTYRISQIAKENHIPVILTGDGGDEIFGGYTRYQVYNQKVGNRTSWSLLCDLYTKILSEFVHGDEWIDEFIDAVTLFAREAYAYTRVEKKKYIRDLGIGLDYDDFWYFRKFYHEELPPITRAQYIDFKTYLPADILTKVDRVSMQNSIETRVPFLSKKLVEFAFGLSQEERCMKGELKGVLKKAYAGLIPEEILYKDKKGFSFPGNYWKRNEQERFIIWKENWE